MATIYVTKADGDREPFDPDKLRESLRRAGVSDTQEDQVLKHVLDHVHDGMSTRNIYAHAFEYLRNTFETPVAARYSVKRAVFDMGPSGYPFEQFVAALLVGQGYTGIRTGAALTGKCAPHEVDVVAQKKIVG